MRPDEEVVRMHYSEHYDLAIEALNGEAPEVAIAHGVLGILRLLQEQRQ